MMLTQLPISRIGLDPVSEISIGILYYVHSGRNAWHSTWIKRYLPGCMHTTIYSAKDYAEGKRARGTVFYIKQIPCIYFKTQNETLIITEINNDNPLSGYSPDATTDLAPQGAAIVAGARNNYLKLGVPLQYAGLSFEHNSRFWRTMPPLDNSVITLSAGPRLRIEKMTRADTTAFKSYALGDK